MTREEIIQEATQQRDILAKTLTNRKEFWGIAYERAFGYRSAFDETELAFLNGVLRELA